MERDSKFMLKYLLDNMNLPDGHTLFVEFYDKFQKDTGWEMQRVWACIRYLENEGYIKYLRDEKGTSHGFALEHKAYRKAAFTRRSVISFLIKSVVVPIAVSAVTTVLTLLISGLL